MSILTLMITWAVLWLLVAARAWPPWKRRVAPSGEACDACVSGRRRLRGAAEAWRSTEAFSMAVLAQLAYEAWEDRGKEASLPLSFEVNASLGEGLSWRRRLLHWADEGGRWARCVWEYRPPAPPGGRLPRPANYTQSRRSGCVRPGHRRWRSRQFFYGWYESGPASTRWHSTCVLVALAEGFVALAFRGSTDARHAITNVQPLTRDDEGLRSLHGMRRAFERVDRGKVALFDPHRIEERRGSLAALLGDIADEALRSGRTVLLAGHSLGGVLALQLALRLPATDKVRVYTFGEPEYGDAEFYAAKRRGRARWIRTNYRRYVSLSAPPNCDPDIVTRVARLFGGEDHFARPIHVCRDTDPPLGAVAAHAMTGYVHALRVHPSPSLRLDYLEGPDVVPGLAPILGGGGGLGKPAISGRKASSSRRSPTNATDPPMPSSRRRRES